MSFIKEDADERLREANVVEIKCVAEKRRDLLVGESSDTASDTCYIECVLVAIACEFNELIDVWLDSLHASLHGGDGI